MRGPGSISPMVSSGLPCHVIISFYAVLRNVLWLNKLNRNLSVGLKFSFNNPVVLCNMTFNYIAPFCVRSPQCQSFYPANLNVEFSEIKTKSAKYYEMSVGDMTSAKTVVSHHSYPHAFLLFFALTTQSFFAKALVTILDPTAHRICMP